jgi:O-methyltransferase
MPAIDLPISFDELFPASMHTQLIGMPKLKGLYRLMQYAYALDGEAAEVGVYKGGTSLFIARAMPAKRLYMYDTFAGMPVEDAAIDFHEIGDFADCSLVEVVNLLHTHNVANTFFRVGVFPESVGDEEDKTFSFVHVDGDQYKTTRDALEFFYPRLAYDGIMVFDDYDWAHCKGVRKALDEFFADKLETVKRSGYSANQAYIVRGQS